MAIVNVPPSSAYEKEEDIQSLIGAHNKNPAAHAGMSFPAKGGNADTVGGKHAAELQNYANLTNKPAFKAVATTGSYTDLINKPTSLPAAGGNANTIGGKTAADLLNYNNMTNKPASLPANGGNADTVGNIPASGFLKAKYLYKGNLDDFHVMEQFVNFTRDECSNTPPGMANWGGLINLGNIQNTHQQIVFDGYSHNIYTRLFVEWNNPPWTAWQKIWHSGNQGANSGLNADMVDGKHAGDFILRSELKALVYSMLQTGEISMVKSIQRGTTTQETVKINAVNVNKAVLLISGGFTMQYKSDEDRCPYGFIKDSTTLGFKWAAVVAPIHWQVIEFY